MMENVGWPNKYYSAQLSLVPITPGQLHQSFFALPFGATHISFVIIVVHVRFGFLLPLAWLIFVLPDFPQMYLVAYIECVQTISSNYLSFYLLLGR